MSNQANMTSIINCGVQTALLDIQDLLKPHYTCRKYLDNKLGGWTDEKLQGMWSLLCHYIEMQSKIPKGPQHWEKHPCKWQLEWEGDRLRQGAFTSGCETL